MRSHRLENNADKEGPFAATNRTSSSPVTDQGFILIHAINCGLSTRYGSKKTPAPPGSNGA